jgi:DNA-binding MarR family transcriptional regulator
MGSEADPEPKDLMVLEAVARGESNESKIAKSTKLTAFEVASIVERLIMHGLIERTEKKGLLGKKTILKITNKGVQDHQARKYELEERWQKMVLLSKQGDKKQFEETVQMNRSWLPAMMFMGIIDMMFFMTMLSMMGMTMNNVMPEGYVDQGQADAGESDAGSDMGDYGDLGDISF